MFKIISTGWQCAQFLEQTLQSVVCQTVQDYQHMVVYDLSEDDGAERIKAWSKEDPSRRHYQINPDQFYALRNQYEGIHDMEPADDDIVVWLDLDGDMLAHPSVLDNLLTAYSDGETLVTYGNYKPVPPAPESPAVVPFPPDVVKNNSYRQHILSGGGCCFNHLRTMKYKVFKNIPIDRFKRADGTWFVSGIDYSVMIPALELAGGKYKCLWEVLCLYNHGNPLADNIVRGSTSTDAVDSLNRPPLQPMKESYA